LPSIIAELGMASHIVAVVNPGRSGLRECPPFCSYWSDTDIWDSYGSNCEDDCFLYVTPCSLVDCYEGFV
jgi:hypothetical protein